ncbi:unnamed protein product, partial [Didymodactylos carnosus]
MLESNDDILSISYRSFQHVFPDNKIIDRSLSSSSSKYDIIRRYLFTGVLIHYHLWFLFIVFVLFLFTNFGYWWISFSFVLLYLPSYLNNDQFKMGRPWYKLKTSKLWWLIHKYMQVEAVRTHQLNKNKQYIFALHPHGILILSRPSLLGGVWETLFPGVETRLLAASPLFWIPGCREICLWTGCINATKTIAEKLLKTDVEINEYNSNGKLSLVIYPGGSKEIFNSDSKSNETILIARQGFVKLAIENGCDIVPGI